MFHKLFETPVWVKKINPARINLKSKNFQRSFNSDTPTTFGQPQNNEIDKYGTDYLLDNILNCLSDLKIKKIGLIEIWRNIYSNDFQERHMHVKSSFSFTVYEKLKQPQTIFYHPAHDMIYALALEPYITATSLPNCSQGDLVVFPSYLEHSVKRTKDAITISGNVRIIE